MKNVLITGAYGGMGQKAVDLFLENGYTVFALDKKPCDKKDGVIPLTCDITNLDSVKDAFFQVKSMVDGLHAIIHFAGVYMLDSLVEMSEESFERIFKINLGGVFLVNKFFMPLLKLSLSH